MAKHVTGRRQHIVPRQMIKNFSGDDGKLVELVKSNMRLGTRRRGPGGILFRDDFYRDAVSDFDAEFLTPIEQKFAQVYPMVLEGTALNGRQGAAFIDWVAAMLVRTQLISSLLPLVSSGLPDELRPLLEAAEKMFANAGRQHLFSLHQDMFARTGWKWKYRRFGGRCLILTDHPVCMTNIYQQGGQMVVVPMASDTVLFGGASGAVESMKDATPECINFFLAAWAHRQIFAADVEILKVAKSTLSEASPFPSASVTAGRLPLFGLPERIEERMKNNLQPEDFDFDKALQQHCESFGNYRWEEGE